jgi:hypothetical protein
MDGLNDKATNEAIADRLKALEARAAQQPVSYIQLFREAIDLAEQQFKRAMAAEAVLFRTLENDDKCIPCRGTGKHQGAFGRFVPPCGRCGGTGKSTYLP